MKKLLSALIAIVIISTGVFGQKPTPSPTPGFELTADEIAIQNNPAATQPYQYLKRNTDPWNYIGEAVELRWKIYYRDGWTSRFGQVSTWLKFKMVAPLKIKGKGAASLNRTAYYLQYATADCEGKRLTLESTFFYDKMNKQIRTSVGFLFDEFYRPVLPGSVGDMVHRALCD